MVSKAPKSLLAPSWFRLVLSLLPSATHLLLVVVHRLPLPRSSSSASERINLPTTFTPPSLRSDALLPRCTLVFLTSPPTLQTLLSPLSLPTISTPSCTTTSDDSEYHSPIPRLRRKVFWLSPPLRHQSVSSRTPPSAWISRLPRPCTDVRRRQN